MINCNYVVISTECEFHSNCSESTPKPRSRIFSKDVIELDNDCWPAQTICITRLLEMMALRFEDSESMNRLAYFFRNSNDAELFKFWAIQSATQSNPEGVFLSGMAELVDQEEHKANPQVARIFFDELYQGINKDIGNDSSKDESFSEIERLEIEAARDIANQIGLHDIEVPGRPDDKKHPRWVQRIAAIYGYSQLALIKYSYWIPHLITIFALVPVLMILLIRRTYLV
jgi:hypothetical protein